MLTVLNLIQHRVCVNAVGDIVASNEADSPHIVMFDALRNGILEVPVTAEVRDFCTHLQKIRIEPEVLTYLMTDSVTSISEKGQISNLQEQSQTPATGSSEEIWVKNSGKHTPQDLQTTNKLLEIVDNDRFQCSLKDKTTKKKIVWGEIGKEMVLTGYSFKSRDPENVCLKKWRNMEEKTVGFIQKGGPKNSGGEKVPRPAYYDEVHYIIKDYAKAHPMNLPDSVAIDEVKSSGSNGSKTLLDHRTNKRTSEMLSDDEEDALSKTSSFSKVSTTIKPKKTKTDNSAVLEFLKADTIERKKAEDDMHKLLGKNGTVLKK